VVADAAGAVAGGNTFGLLTISYTFNPINTAVVQTANWNKTGFNFAIFGVFKFYWA
jgi:hypothetical protein